MLPLLVVFGLDFTFWPFWIGTHVYSPFHKTSHNTVLDQYDEHAVTYKDVPLVLKTLNERRIKVGITSVTHDPEGSLQLLDIFDLRQYIQYVAVGEGMNKIKQFEQLRNESGVEYSDMLFFDDLKKHIRDISEIGVFSVLVPDGINMKLFESGIEEYRRRKLELHSGTPFPTPNVYLGSGVTKEETTVKRLN